MHTFISLFHVSCHDIYIETEKASNEYPWIQKMLLLEPGFSFPCGFHYLRVLKKLRVSGKTPQWRHRFCIHLLFFIEAKMVAHNWFLGL